MGVEVGHRGFVDTLSSLIKEKFRPLVLGSIGRRTSGP